MPDEDIASMSPTDLGRAIALNLEKTCTLGQVSAQDRSLLTEAGIGIDQYHGEQILLAGFACDFAITTLLRNSSVGKQVRNGYLEVWNDMGKHSAAGAAYLQLFFQRCQEYAKAAARMAPGEVVPPIGPSFSLFLASTHAGVQKLALTGGPDLFFSHFEIVAELLAQAQLIKRPGN